MGRHARAVDTRPGYVRGIAVAAVWVAGLGAGFFALLGAATKYTSCSASSTGLACRSSGTVLGVLLVVAVVATVTTVTVVTHGRPPARVARAAGIGLVTLALLYLLAQRLIGTA